MKISVLTPSYNSGKFIGRAIRSVQQQDHTDWEHIVMDGGSTDQTKSIVAQYPHLVWISEKDAGQSDAMNKAFARSSGDIIVYLNADDEIATGIFSKISARFEAEATIDAVIGNLYCRLPDGGFDNTASIKLDDIADINGEMNFPFNPVAYYYKRTVQEKIGPFPLEEHMAMDYWFLLRLYKTFRIVKEEQVFGTFHMTGENKTSDFLRSKTALYKVLRDFVYEYRLHQYDAYLDRFIYLSLQQAQEYKSLYESLNKKQRSLQYLGKQLPSVLSARLKKLLGSKTTNGYTSL